MSWISDDDKTFITGQFFSGHWLTFNHQNLIVHREPKKTISNPSASSYYGYSNSNNDNVEMVPQSSVFPCIVRHKVDKQEGQFMPETMTRIIDGDVRIKILADAKDYIKADKVISIQIDDQHYDINSEPFTQDFLGLKFYYYDLNKRK